MHYALLLLILILLAFGPQFWARYTFQRYAKPQKRIPGTGGELAKHLIEQFEIPDVKVEKTEPGQDHYDPSSKCVRLSPDNYDQNSLTAVAIAAHEVGHAIQHFRQEPTLLLRTRLAVFARYAERIGGGAMVFLPIVLAMTHAPGAGLLMLILGFGAMAIGTLVHLVTLPMEYDASFGKALPILKAGNYIDAKDEIAVRRILRAAAFTYVAASLATLLNLWRWLRFFRR